MLGSKKIKLPKFIYTDILEILPATGYETVEDYVTDLVRRDLARRKPRDIQEEEEIKKRLQGLGYIS
ncbi:MAG: hypothetical protein JRG73_12190 [Deltaproteobacteria bacterium]|nr:hypothetical protein [Deltaproteobacteria bacterium]